MHGDLEELSEELSVEIPKRLSDIRCLNFYGIAAMSKEKKAWGRRDETIVSFYCPMKLRLTSLCLMESGCHTGCVFSIAVFAMSNSIGSYFSLSGLNGVIFS